MFEQGLGWNLVKAGNVGVGLVVAAWAIGWPVVKLAIHVSVLGMLLLCSQPGFSPGLSRKWLGSGLSADELSRLANVVKKT
ncbi:hypothetical protein BASA81_007389 [Batrachochytrium salamandrivorans]|nr:hypothetical protein BASA81_018100 [Batrachochytrium salamandrivorans]KAH9254632.1 hypothetical protein BASA81_007389 [Batrachochytrium salamandrivorans]